MGGGSVTAIRTFIGGAVGRGQVGASLPGLGLVASLAALAVLARGVVLTLALQVAVLQQAQRGVQVTLTPGDGTHTDMQRGFRGQSRGWLSG